MKPLEHSALWYAMCIRDPIIRKQAVSNVAEQKIKHFLQNRRLDQLFIFSETPEKNDYWQKIYYLSEEHPKEFWSNTPIYDAITPLAIGTVLKIIDAGDGAMGANNQNAIVIADPKLREKEISGIFSTEPGYYVKLLNNFEIWRINQDAVVEVLGHTSFSIGDTLTPAMLSQPNMRFINLFEQSSNKAIKGTFNLWSNYRVIEKIDYIDNLIVALLSDTNNVWVSLDDLKNFNNNNLKQTNNATEKSNQSNEENTTGENKSGISSSTDLRTDSKIADEQRSSPRKGFAASYQIQPEIVKNFN